MPGATKWKTTDAESHHIVAAKVNFWTSEGEQRYIPWPWLVKQKVLAILSEKRLLDIANINQNIQKET